MAKTIDKLNKHIEELQKIKDNINFYSTIDNISLAGLLTDTFYTAIRNLGYIVDALDIIDYDH